MVSGSRSRDPSKLLISILLIAILMFGLSSNVLAQPNVKEEPSGIESDNFIELSTINGKNVVSTYADTIVIMNKSNHTLSSIRIMLSPEISDMFYLDTSSIREIQPNGNATVGIKLFGSPNKDAYGKITEYNGSIMVMTPNHNPVMLPVKIGEKDSSQYQAYVQKITDMANQRYRISLINTVLDTPAEKHDLEITTRDGSREIGTPSEEVLIKNASDRTLNNVRILVSKGGNAFLLDKYNIPEIAANGEVSIQMIAKIDTSKYSPRDYRGEIIIAPDNGVPSSIPVYIPATPMHDSMNDFEVRIAGSEMTAAVDKIAIKNVGDRPMDSVKIMLSENLARVFSLSNNTFRAIAPDEEVTVDIKYNTKELKTFLQNHSGEIKILSEHHNMQNIPVNIVWNKVENDHFVVYARNNDTAMADDVLKYLESNYNRVKSTIGTVDQKARIYMAGSMEEMQLFNSHSFYSYGDDVIFLCACDNPKENALQEFIYRVLMMKYASYYNMKKIENDNGNWLVNGVAKYIAVKNNNEDVAKYIDAFEKQPTEFQWYGNPSDAKYGAVITFFKYLELRFGEQALHRSLYHLGSGMVSNHRCDTVENCATLWGVYDSIGWKLDNKRHTLNVSKLIEEWKSFVKEKYGISVKENQ